MEVLPELLAEAKTVFLPTGAKVFEPGTKCSMFVVLKSGRIRVDLISRFGKPLTLYHFGAGETCVLTTSCLMSGDLLCGEATVEQDVTAYVFSPEQFEAYLAASPDFRRLVFQSFADRLSDMMEKIDSVVSVPIDARLAAALIDLAGETGEAKITQDALAKEIGSAREVVSRKLAQWKEEGLIATSRGVIKLINMGEIRKKRDECD